MIDVGIALKLLLQCRGMQGAPRNKEDLTMRAEALAKRAGSEAHAAAVVATLVERLTFFPSVADLAQACLNTDDPSSSVARERRSECRYCHGEGWRTVDGPNGTTAAYPCNHTVEGNPRMGVKIPPALAGRYREESREADARQLAWLERRVTKPQEGFRRVTQADVDDAILGERA